MQRIVCPLKVTGNTTNQICMLQQHIHNMQNIESTYTKQGFKVLTDKHIQTSAAFFCWAPQRTLERHRRPVCAAAQHSAVSICSNKHDLRAQFTPRLCFRCEWVSCFKLAACKQNSSPSAPAQLSRSAFSWKEFFLFPNAIWLYLQSLEGL